MKQEVKNIDKNIIKFDKLLSEFVSHFLTVDPTLIEHKINQIIKLISEDFKMEQVFLVRMPDNKRGARIEYYHVSPGINVLSNPSLEDMTWIVKKIKGGNPVIFFRIPDDLPEEATEERKFYVKEGIKAAFVFPYEIKDSVCGFLCLHSLHGEITDREEFVKRAQNLSTILGVFLEYKYAMERIDELKKFERLLSEISVKYINLPVEEVEKVAKHDFGKLAALLEVTRCALHIFDQPTPDFLVLSSKEVCNTMLRQLAWWSEEDIAEVAYQKELLNQQPEKFSGLRYLLHKISKGEVLKWTSLDDLPEEANEFKFSATFLGSKSALVVPIFAAKSVTGMIAVTDTRIHRIWSEDMIPRLRLFGEVFANALLRKQSEQNLQKAFTELKQIKDRLEADYKYVREQIDLEQDSKNIVGSSEIFKATITKARQSAPMNVTVLLLGETGVGKGLIAQIIHNESKRSNRPMIQVNCAALSPTLIESELFGHEKGAFTGAHARKIGRFELADGSTLFLDEIGELPLEVQGKLLHVLQDGRFQRVGGTTTIKVNVRMIAATNQNLERAIKEGRFRSDLWYRINVFPILIPPLRDRLEDISLFVNYFMKKYMRLTGKHFNAISQNSIKMMKKYLWPGNIRELENLVERAVITCATGGDLQIEVPATDNGCDPFTAGQTLDEVEKAHIIRTLNETGWVIEGPLGASGRLGLNPATLPRLRQS